MTTLIIVNQNDREQLLLYFLMVWWEIARELAVLWFWWEYTRPDKDIFIFKKLFNQWNIVSENVLYTTHDLNFAISPNKLLLWTLISVKTNKKTFTSANRNWKLLPSSMPLSNVNTLQKLESIFWYSLHKIHKNKTVPKLSQWSKKNKNHIDYIKTYRHIISPIIRNNETCVFPCSHAWPESAEHCWV